MQVLQVRGAQDQVPPPAARSCSAPSPSALALRQAFWELLQTRLSAQLHAMSCEAFGVEALPPLLGLAAGEGSTPYSGWRRYCHHC